VTSPATSSTTAINSARFIPNQGLAIFLECDGLAAHATAWEKSSAYQILTQTPTGAMFEEILVQVMDRSAAAQAPGAPQWGKDLVALLKQGLRSGMAFGLSVRPNDNERPLGWTLVFTGAMNPESKAIYASLIRILITPPNTTVESVPKGSLKVARVVGPAVNMFFWVDPASSDLIMTDDPDAAIAAAEGTAPSAMSNEIRQRLTASEGAYQSVIRAFVVASEARKTSGQMGQFFTQAEGVGLQGLEYRWGIEGQAIMDDLRLVAPKPRQGQLALLDQPTFDPEELLARPGTAKNFGQLSLDAAGLYQSLRELATASAPEADAELKGLEDAVYKASRQRLKEDFLANLGPRAFVYQVPVPKTPSNPLTSLGQVGFQVPKMVILAEVKDQKKMTAALDALVLWANKEFKQGVPGLTSGESAPASPGGAGTPGPEGAESAPARGRNAAAGGRNTAGSPAAKSAAVPEFRPQMAGQTKLHALTLPTGMAALTNARPALAVGKKHLIIATDAATAREALTSEAKLSDGAEPLTTEVSTALSAMPKNLILLAVTDPSESLPAALANLPQSVNEALAQGAASSPASGTTVGSPAAPPATAAPAAPPTPAGPRGRGRGDEEQEFVPGSVQFGKGSIAGSGRPRVKGLSIAGGEEPAEGEPPPPSAPTAPATPPGASPAAVPPIQVEIDPALVPKPEQITPHLFPGSVAVAVDDQGFRLTTRQAFYDLSASFGNQAQIQQLLSSLGINPGAGGSPLAVGSTPPAAGETPAGPTISQPAPGAPGVIDRRGMRGGRSAGPINPNAPGAGEGEDSPLGGRPGPGGRGPATKGRGAPIPAEGGTPGPPGKRGGVPID
jgi:hypothetical protein